MASIQQGRRNVKIFGGVKIFGVSKFSSYIFIKSLIQNQTKLEFDFKDPVLFFIFILLG